MYYCNTYTGTFTFFHEVSALNRVALIAFMRACCGVRVLPTALGTIIIIIIINIMYRYRLNIPNDTRGQCHEAHSTAATYL